jgi:O-methyltransferase
MKMLNQATDLSDIYLDLLKKSLTRFLTDDGYLSLHYRTHGKVKDLTYKLIENILNPFDLELVKHNQFKPEIRKVGKDWPATAETMIGLTRLDNIQELMLDVLKKDVEGDFIETGVWRGGATIFMRAVLKAYNIKNRAVWVADSFKGLPKLSRDADKDDVKAHLWTFPQLSVSLGDVRKNFSKYGLLDDQVKFLPGWFSDTLFHAPIKRLALIRLDGDMYESTMDALNALYPKLSVGGYLIVDDYCLPACRKAIKDFRKKVGIRDRIEKIDWASVYWKKSE